MSQIYNPERSSYILQQTPTFIHPNKTFTIMGFVVEVNLEMDWTLIKILVITFKNKNEVREMFDIYFIGEVRSFADKYAKIGDLAHVTGELIISKTVIVNDEKVIRLLAKHAYIYRKYESAYKQISEIIKAEETDNEELAF